MRPIAFFAAMFVLGIAAMPLRAADADIPFERFRLDNGLTVVVHLFGSSLEGMLLMLSTVVGAIALNGVVAVRLVRHGYLQRGWRLGY